MSQIRAFLAIDLDDDLKPKINKIIREFKKTDARIKYVDLVNLHLTLKFFGEIDTEGLNLLEDAISNVLGEFDSFNIKIKGCGAFPNNNRINVIWVGIDEDSIIRDMHDKLDKEFVRLGLDKDRKFSTHLTIGRMKSAKNKNKVKSTIEEFSDVEIGEMEVTKVSLKKSTLTPAGPIYEDLKIFEL
ncbi:MAG: RNA 2',3'-cyclic phosphodiesterase [Methanobrevibacter thaueri]|jgi:2'-5' RNA ligase|uniref:RNA 2',3'-cyclic phosphodiesterase n=1 Tax=Methanobrevibacter thaueri TaxID=190975 RepID=A0A8T3V3F9_9EURY|nr:RNA 2',3'-cyclic phosphodiesterase [Methanobrevibacter thaueri]MBE6501072.1 RNA 2',3'-cyclic phosphodiesterase [Methanobrevibacter thaueri]